MPALYGEEHRDFSVDRVRVCFVTSMMTGRAARWASAKLEPLHYLDAQLPSLHDRMKHAFEDPKRREAAKRKIRRFCAREWGRWSTTLMLSADDRAGPGLERARPDDQYHEASATTSRRSWRTRSGQDAVGADQPVHPH